MTLFTFLFVAIFLPEFWQNSDPCTGLEERRWIISATSRCIGLCLEIRNIHFVFITSSCRFGPGLNDKWILWGHDIYGPDSGRTKEYCNKMWTGINKVSCIVHNYQVQVQSKVTNPSPKTQIQSPEKRDWFWGCQYIILPFITFKTSITFYDC